MILYALQCMINEKPILAWSKYDVHSKMGIRGRQKIQFRYQEL